MGVTAQRADGPVIAVIGEVVADAVVDAAVGSGAPGAPAAHDGACAPRAAGPPPGTETLSLTVHPGGGPANTALALARLGGAARFAGRFSVGTLGRLCRSRLAASGVDLRAAVDVPEPATLAITSLGPDGSAAYEFYAQGTADWGWTGRELDALVDPSVGPRPVAVHTGTLALARQPSGRVIEAFLRRVRRSSTVSIDPNLRTGLIPVAVYREAIGRWAALADVIKLSADDAAQLWPGVPIGDALRRLHDAGATLVVVTRGGAGSMASLRTGGVADDVIVETPAVPTDVADTVGAGDAFAAGLLHRLAAAGALGGRLGGLGTPTLRSALDVAGRVAAITCSRPGADPPWAAELADHRPFARW